MISVNKRIKTGALLAVAALAVSACSSDSKSDSTTASTAATTTPSSGSTVTSETPTSDSTVTSESTPTSGSTATTGGDTADGVTTEGISDERCAENKAAGKITYLSSFDFSASASIIDVVVAKEKGYFEKMCLDVSLTAGFSTTNYPTVAVGDDAQFSSAGNYSEILNNTGDGADFVALLDYGKAPIEELLTPDGGATKLEDLKGKTIGVKGDLPPSIVAMLAKAGLKRGTDYKELQLDGFDPVAQLSSGIDALPVYKSNEPNQLDAAGIKYNTFDPVDSDTPGSFGLIYTSKQYAADHPTVVADFARASLKGMEDAIADPAAAVASSLKLINAAGNQYFLTEAGENFRWNAEIKVMQEGTPSGEPVGLIDPDILANEYSTYVDAGVWPDGAPTDGKDYLADVATSLYDSSGKVIWPAS